MNSNNSKNTWTNLGKLKESSPTMFTILLTAQMAASLLMLPAAYKAWVSPGTTVEKTIEGITFPHDIYTFISKLVQNKDAIARDIDILTKEDAWFFERRWVDKRLGKEAIKIWIKEVLGWKQWVENLRDMPIGTLISVVLTLLFYLSIMIGSRTLRLEDNDTILDAQRKKTWRKLNKITDDQVILWEIDKLKISEDEAIAILKNALSELENRNL